MQILQTPRIFFILVTTVVCSAQATLGPSAQKQEKEVTGFLVQEIQVSSEPECSQKYTFHSLTVFSETALIT